MTERLTTTDRGLTIATDRVLGARSVAIGVWVGVGSRDEPVDHSGVSHFLEHLLFKGTPTRSATDISRAVDRVGGDINAFTAKEYTAYYCRLPQRHLALGVELLGDALTSSTIADADVESERQVILEELAMDDDAPDDVALRTLASRVFDDHGLGRETAGERHTVRAMAADDVRSFWREHYRTGQLDRRRRRRRRSRRDRARGARSSFAAMPEGGTRPPRAAPGSADALIASRSTTTPSRCTSHSGAERWPATTAIAKRSTSSITSSAAGCRRACSTRSVSVAGWPTACSRRPRPTPVPGPGRCTPARCPSTPTRCWA